MSKPRTYKGQHFHYSHAKDAKFDSGLRSYAAYRDLGFAKASGGAAIAHVIKFKPPLCVSREEMDRALSTFDDILTEIA